MLILFLAGFVYSSESPDGVLRDFTGVSYHQQIRMTSLPLFTVFFCFFLSPNFLVNISLVFILRVG